MNEKKRLSLSKSDKLKETEKENDATEPVDISSLDLSVITPSDLHKNIMKSIKEGIINGTNYELLISVLDKIPTDKRLNTYLKLYNDKDKIEKNSPLLKKIINQYIYDKLDAKLDILDVYCRDFKVNQNHYNKVNITAFIESIRDKVLKNKDSEFLIFKGKFTEANYKNIAMLSYIYLSLNHDTISKVKDDYERKLIIHRSIIEYFSSLNPDNINHHLNHALVDALDGRSFLSDFQKQVYLYSDSYEELSKIRIEKEELSGTIADLNEHIHGLMKKIEALKQDLNTKDEDINELRNDNQNKITDKNDAENRLEYEKAKYLNHLETYKQSILQEVKSDLDLEILGIRNIIQYADQDLINKMERRLKRIEIIINNKME